MVNYGVGRVFNLLYDHFRKMLKREQQEGRIMHSQVSLPFCGKADLSTYYLPATSCIASCGFSYQTSSIRTSEWGSAFERSLCFTWRNKEAKGSSAQFSSDKYLLLPVAGSGVLRTNWMHRLRDNIFSMETTSFENKFSPYVSSLPRIHLPAFLLLHAVIMQKVF